MKITALICDDGGVEVLYAMLGDIEPKEFFTAYLNSPSDCNPSLTVYEDSGREMPLQEYLDTEGYMDSYFDEFYYFEKFDAV